MSRASNELRYDDYLASSYRPTFDGMRGIGFLLVITAHIPSVPLFSYLQGWTAVWLFFVISGYLVTMLLMREEKSQGRVAFGPFLVKRFFRIVPSYWMAILIYWLACFALPPLADDYDSFMERLPYFLGFMPEYANANGYSIFTHSWTVGVELKFYLLFPPVVFLMIKNANWRLAVTAMMAALLTAIGSFNAQSYCAILCGVMLALALERPRGYAIIAMLTRVPVAVPLAFVVAVFVMLRYTEQLTVVALVATYLVAYCDFATSRRVAGPDLATAGLSRPAILWRLPASLSGDPHRIYGIRQRHGDRRFSDSLLLSCRHRAGGGVDVPGDRAARHGFRPPLPQQNRIAGGSLGS